VLETSTSKRIPRVRIRGIYATALTQLLLKYGFQIVQTSRVISERFSIPQLNLPADVTIKNSDIEPSELLIIGYPWAVGKLLDIIKKTLPYSFYWQSKLQLYSTVRAKIVSKNNNTCIVSIDSVEAELVLDNNTNCREGETVTASVIRPGVKPIEKPRLVPGLAVIGDYAILRKTSSPRVTISEHIRSPYKKAELLEAATNLVTKKISVHWRSNSRFAKREELEKHLEELEKQLQLVEDRSREINSGVVNEGEQLVLVHLSSYDKKVLDKLRSETTPTTPLHHSLKSIEPQLQLVVDLADKLVSKGVDPRNIEESIIETLSEKLQERKTVKILHIKPDGRTIEIGPAYIKNIYAYSGKIIILLERRVRSRGIYDGLGVEKELGDTIETEIDTSSWKTTHKYYSKNGELKGIYININTPPEVGLDTIKYLDLEVDIVRTPSQKPQVIDKELLEKHLNHGIITKQLYEKIEEEIKKIL